MHSASVLRVTHIFGNKPLPLASFWCKRASCRLGVVIYIYIYIYIVVSIATVTRAGLRCAVVYSGYAMLSYIYIIPTSNK